MPDPVHAPSPAQEVTLLLLVSDDPVVEAAVRVSCPPSVTLTTHALESVVDARNALSAHGQQVVEAAEEAAALLVAWEMEKAPVINTLGYHLRRALAAPVVALCRTPEECVAAHAAGADYAVTFPLHVPLLRAHTVAYHRLVRAARLAGPGPAAEAPGRDPEAGHDVLRFGELRLDRTAHRFFIGGTEVELTPREFALLDYLIQHAGSARTRDQILNAVWGIDFDTGTNMVDVYMYFLRRKLEAHDVTGVIQTVRGYGYRLAAAETSEP